MQVPYGESAYIYGLHDRGGEALMIQRKNRQKEAKGWVLVTEEIRANPNDMGRRSYYKKLADDGLGVIVRLNHAYGNDGTIPHSSQYDNFARRAANFVRNSPGAHIWLVGNEMNLEREQPRGERITPRLYAECYKKVRAAIKALPGHENDQVVVGAIGPWNAETPYDADPLGAYPANKISKGAPAHYPYNGFFGDYIRYFRDMLLAIGRENCDAIAIHAYSHGYNPKLVFSDEKMGAPFQRYHYHFRTYRDQMRAIPPAFRDLPVYLTEANGDEDPGGVKWPDVNSGWIKNAYREINDWNKAGNQQIRCLILYRWSRDDDWHIDGKPNVQKDFKQAIARNYRWDPNVHPSTAAPAAQIKDISAALPTNPALPPYGTRPRSAIRRIVINHTATGPTVTPQRIAQYQTTNQKFPRPGIAYHYCVTDAGEVYQTQPLEVVSNHAGQFSADSVGVCLIGNFTDAPPPQAQLNAAAALIAYLAQELGLPADDSTIAGYSELAVTASPGATWPQWKDSLIAEANSALAGGATAAARPGYLAQYLSHNTPTAVTANQTLTVDITLQNAGIFTWTQGGANPFHLGFKWYDGAGREVQFPSRFDFRTSFPTDIAPNQVVSVRARLRTPPAPGLYRLRWDMVHEQVTWFETQDDPGLVIDGITVATAAPVSPFPGAQPVTPTLPTGPATQPALQPALPIKDIGAALPTNPALPPYGTRPRSAIRRIVINHTATGPTVTPQRIAQYQTTNQKFPRPGIAYHYCITDAGEVYQTQPLEVVSNHAGQFSADSVGVCLIGNFTDAPPPQAQLNAAAALIGQLAGQLGLPADDSTIAGYSELAVTASPGATWPQWKPALVAQAAALSGAAAPATAPAPVIPTGPLPAGKTIHHYLLLWHQGADNWAEWDLLSAIDYIGAFKPTVGFSIEEAKTAEYVTIVGGVAGVPAGTEQALRAAGCKVERLDGASQEETNQMLYELVSSGRPFRTLQ